MDSLGSTREAGKDQLDSLGGTREAGKDQLNSLRGTREAGKSHLDSLGGTRDACSRIWKGAGFCLTCNTISMANGPIPGKSWGGRHGVPLTGRHQGGRKGPFGQLERHQGGQPWRHQGGRKGSIGQPGRHQGGRKGSIGQQGGTRETCSAGLPIESRFWKGAGFCLTFNTISMANGPGRGKSLGELHGRLPLVKGLGCNNVKSWFRRRPRI